MLFLCCFFEAQCMLSLYGLKRSVNKISSSKYFLLCFPKEKKKSYGFWNNMSNWQMNLHFISFLFFGWITCWNGEKMPLWVCVCMWSLTNLAINFRTQGGKEDQAVRRSSWLASRTSWQAWHSGEEHKHKTCLPFNFTYTTNCHKAGRQQHSKWQYATP